jgi:3-hydroxyacyl-[acyl-carrier-protein] dehydratase
MFPPVTSIIPHRPPFLFVDEIVSESPGCLVARRTWDAGEPFYAGHYPGAPITPGVLLCESVFQAGALCLARSGVEGRVPGALPLLVKIGEARFRQPVLPGTSTTIEVRVKESLGGFTLMSGVVKAGEKRVLTVDFTVAWGKP